MFRTELLSIIGSLNTVYTAMGISHASYGDCASEAVAEAATATAAWPRQQTVNITSMTNTYCCVYSVETPDDGQQICPKHVEFFISNKLEK